MARLHDEGAQASTAARAPQAIVCLRLRVTNKRWLGFRLRELVLDAKLSHMWRETTPW